MRSRQAPGRRDVIGPTPPGGEEGPVTRSPGPEPPGDVDDDGEASAAASLSAGGRRTQSSPPRGKLAS
jgi:hypothetical protein